MREWVKQAERDSGERQDGGLASTEREELAQLRRENLWVPRGMAGFSGDRLSFKSM